MQELKNNALEIIGKYEKQLASIGIKIVMSKKYFEAEVCERSGGVNAAQSILNSIDRARDRKKEDENGYNYQKNRYHCIVISVLPTDKHLVPKDSCRDYAFFLRKVERAHIGQKPQQITYEEDKVLSKIEKRILKILKKAENTTAQKLCKDTVCDAFRYWFLQKYAYKIKFCGKNRFTWDMIFAISAAVATIAVVVIAWAVGTLF